MDISVLNRETEQLSKGVPRNRLESMESSRQKECPVEGCMAIVVKLHKHFISCHKGQFTRERQRSRLEMLTTRYIT